MIPAVEGREGVFKIRPLFYSTYEGGEMAYFGEYLLKQVMKKKKDSWKYKFKKDKIVLKIILKGGKKKNGW